MTEAWCPLSHVPLRAEASDRAECVNEVLAGETATVLSEGPGNWVEVKLPDGYTGWMDRRQLRPVTSMWLGSPQRTTALSSAWDGVPGGWLPAGACVREHEGRWHLGEMEVTPNEGAIPRPTSSMWAWARTMLHVPYHWGGRSGWGVDCSGLVSLAAALRGRTVPRDASQQFLVGLEVESEACQMDDVAFFCNPEGRITHVGLCDGQGHILHASGEVRMDLLQDGQILQTEDHQPTHTLAGIRRWFP